MYNIFFGKVKFFQKKISLMVTKFALFALIDVINKN